MTDNRSLAEITGQHPVPWAPKAVPMMINGQTLIKVFDKAGLEVPLFTMLRVVQLVTDKLAQQSS